MVRPRSEDIPATDLQPNGSLISVSSSLKRPVTAIKDSSPPLPSHPRPLLATGHCKVAVTFLPSQSVQLQASDPERSLRLQGAAPGIQLPVESILF